MQTRHTIEIIKAKFEMIRILLREEFAATDLECGAYRRALIAATENTYVHLNDSMCDNLVMCRHCAQKRELLMQYLHLLDDLDNGSSMTSEMRGKLEAFPKLVNETIERINHVLSQLTA